MTPEPLQSITSMCCRKNNLAHTQLSGSLHVLRLTWLLRPSDFLHCSSLQPLDPFWTPRQPSSQRSLSDMDSASALPEPDPAPELDSLVSLPGPSLSESESLEEQISWQRAVARDVVGLVGWELWILGPCGGQPILHACYGERRLVLGGRGPGSRWIQAAAHVAHSVEHDGGYTPF